MYILSKYIIENRAREEENDLESRQNERISFPSEHFYSLSHFVQMFIFRKPELQELIPPQLPSPSQLYIDNSKTNSKLRLFIRLIRCCESVEATKKNCTTRQKQQSHSSAQPVERRFDNSSKILLHLYCKTQKQRFKSLHEKNNEPNLWMAVVKQLNTFTFHMKTP